MITPYTKDIEDSMQEFFNSLSEKDKRRYAAIEAQKLGHSGITYIAKLLKCSRSTVYQGLKELKTLPNQKLDSRVRRKGGGRKGYEQTYEGIDEAFLHAVQNDIAGDPMSEDIRWTYLTHEEIKQRLFKQSGINVSVTVIKKLLKKHRFKRRQAEKKQTMKQVEGRDEQFEHIATLKAQYQQAGQPIISMDTKKKKC